MPYDDVQSREYALENGERADVLWRLEDRLESFIEFVWFPVRVQRVEAVVEP